MKNSKSLLFTATLLLTITTLHATNLSIGADYHLKSISITERDKTVSSNHYFDQQLIAYLITDLSKDVEATIRVQSITPWGLEGSSNALTTRYPQSNGTLWLQNAFVRLPGLWNDHLTLTLGRQPLLWGDGTILSDDELGMDAVRAQIKSPWRFLPVEAEAFTAKIATNLTTDKDSDLHGALLGFNREAVRWELMGLWEKSDDIGTYTMGSEIAPVTSTKLERTIYGIRAKTNLKDAYLKGEYYTQQGSIRRSPGANDIKLGGDGYIIGLGGKQNTDKFGRFGAVLEIATGSGDDPNTAEKDEAFRPSFGARWSGLERKGYGRYFASTLSDAYSPTDPFSPATSSNDGLPDGLSGIQTVRFGMEATPWSQWSFYFDYYQYKAQKALAGKKELGTEFDYAVVYRYSGLVQMRGSINNFNPGEAFDESTRQKATWSSLEVELKF